MKKIILVFLLISSFLIINGQEEVSNNKFLVGGSANFLLQNNTYPFSSLNVISGIGGIYSQGTNQSKNTSFAITPYVAKEISKHLMLGVQLDFRIGKYSTDNFFNFGQPTPITFERNSNQFGVGIFTRYIFNPDNKFKLFLQPNIEYNLLKEKEYQEADLSQEEKARYIEVGLGAGAIFEITDRFRAILRSGGLSYLNGSWEVLETEIENNFSSFSANFRLSAVSLGVEFMF